MKTPARFPILLLVLLFEINSTSFSQVVKSEGFDGTQFPPFGWTTGKISGSDINNFTERVTTGTAPVCVPHSGAGMLRYRSGFMFNAGDQLFVASPKFDLTNNPGTATVSFWLFRDNFNAIPDSLGVYMNDSAFANPSRGSMTAVTGNLTRAGGVNSWVNYTFTIPAGYNNSSAYVIFIFTNRETSGTGANMYFDDFSIQTYPKASVLVSSELFYQESSDVPKGQTDQLVIGIKVIVDGAGDGVTNSFQIDSIVTNATGTSNIAADIVASSAKIWYTKGTNAFTTTAGNQFGNGITPGFFRDKFSPPSTFFLENGDNYFWLSYSTTNGAISNNFIDADFNGIYYRRPGYAGADTSRVPLVSSLPGARQIDVALCNGIIPTLWNGTTGWSGNFTSNDFINRVYLRGQNSLTPSYPFLDNNINDFGPPVAPWFGGPAPFSAHPPDYQQFPQTANSLHPNITAVLAQGQVYTTPSLIAGNPVGAGLALQCGTWNNNNYMAAWIDFNKDGDLLEPGEKIHQSGPMNSLTWTFSAVTVPAVVVAPSPGVAGPAGIVYGNVKMRIREVYGNSNILPCQSGYTFGETEDYILSIIPACPVGVKLWLGYTDDWNTPSNWCGGVPTINDIVLIDEVGYLGGTQTGAPYDPVIHSGTTANAKTIRISGTDSLIINAPSAGALNIADSLVISYNTPAGGGGYLAVKSSFKDTAQLSNGNLGFNITPFTATRKNQRLQIIYTPEDLVNKGVRAGDKIDSLYFWIKSRATSPAFAGIYNKFFITWAKVTPGFSKWPSIPVSLASAGPYTVLRDSATGLNITAALGAGVGRLAVFLPNPLVWNGTDTIVLNISYNNSLVSLAGVVANDLVTQTQTTGSNRTMWINNSTTNSGNTRNWPLAAGDVAFTSQFKPNITFHFSRPHDRFPINMTGNAAVTAGNWINNGTFVAGYSNVTFSNTSLNQHIGGFYSSTFNELTVSKGNTAGVNGLIMGTTLTVDSFLVLNSGYIDLNQNLLSVSYSATTSISRTSGWIRSENTPTAYGRLRKNIGTVNGTHLFPFGTVSGTYIPFSLNLTSGNIGQLTLSTFPTAQNNTPYANDGTTGGTVTHVFDKASGLDLSVQNAADRFWQINKTGPSGTASITFTITTPERPTNAGTTNNSLKPQLWENPTATGNQGWKEFVNAFSHSALSNTVVLNAVTQFDGPWVLSNVVAPLSDSLFNCPSVDPPTAVSPAGNITVCNGTSLNLNATSSGNSIFWFTTPSGGSSIGNVLSGVDFPVTPAGTITYYAEARDSNGCKSLTRTATGIIDVDSVPNTAISASGPTTFCTGSSVNLTAGGGGSFLWSTGDTNTSIIVSNTGTYSVIASYPNGCADSAQVTVTVNPLPSVSVSASPGSICKNETSVLTASGASSYTWSPATGLSATTGAVVTAQPLITTTYSITGTAGTGCVKTVTKKITVKTLPTLTLTPSAANICPGASQVITAGGTGTTYSWLPFTGLNVTSGTTVTASPSASTTYTVTATHTNGCTKTKTSALTIKCPVTNGLTVTNITGSSADLSWTNQPCAIGYRIQYRVIGSGSWFTININTNTPSHTLTGLQVSTSYEWKVATKCSGPVFAVYSAKSSFTTAGAREDSPVLKITGNSLTIYPNPASEKIYLEFQSVSNGPARLSLINGLGKVLDAREFSVTDHAYADELIINTLASGLYLIKIEQGDEILMARFVKE